MKAVSVQHVAAAAVVAAIVAAGGAGPIQSVVVSAPAPTTVQTADGSGGADGSPDPVTVQPGMQMESRCTLGFLATNETGHWYGFTAGHCVQYEGRSVEVMENGTAHTVGTFVAHNESNDWQAEDWALIRFTDNRSRAVFDPAVRHWTGPTGPATGAPAFDDVICFYGQGLVSDFEQMIDDRTRCGRFDHWGYNAFAGREVDGWFTGWMEADSGDSGGPFVHYPSGRALGIIVSGSIAANGLVKEDVDGQTACALLYHAHTHGYNLTLATAPYDPPPPQDPGPSMLVQEPHEQGIPADDMCDELREIRAAG